MNRPLSILQRFQVFNHRFSWVQFAQIKMLRNEAGISSFELIGMINTI